MNYNYSFYLFCKLRDIVIPSQEAYDLSYSEDMMLFEEYQVSLYNTDEKGEYECILDFLKHKKDIDGYN